MQCMKVRNKPEETLPIWRIRYDPQRMSKKMRQEQNWFEKVWHWAEVQPYTVNKMLPLRITDCQSVSKPPQHMLLCRCHMEICQALSQQHRNLCDMGVNEVTAHIHLCQHMTAMWLLEICMTASAFRIGDLWHSLNYLEICASCKIV